jgi:hypothetical protein
MPEAANQAGFVRCSGVGLITVETGLPERRLYEDSLRSA